MSRGFVAGADFNAQARTLTIRVDFAPGTRFVVPGVAGEHPVHDTISKRYRHLNFFQHECILEVRVPRVKLPDGAVRQVEPPWAGKLSGFTLLFEALVLMLCQQMTHELAIDETSRARGHDYITLVADAGERRVLAVAEGRSVETIATVAGELDSQGCAPGQITSMSIDMSPAFIKGCAEHLHTARITFDKFHVGLACQTRGGQDAPHRAAHRPLPQGDALVAAQGSFPPLVRGRRRPRCLDRQDDHGAGFSRGFFLCIWRLMPLCSTDRNHSERGGCTIE